MIISSKENENIKEIKKLKDKKYRNEKFIIEGIKMLQEAIEEKAQIEQIVVREGNMGTLKQNIEIESNSLSYKVIEVSENVFKDLSDVVTPQGILAVIKKNNNTKIDYNADFILVLDGIQDPGNLGTIIRTADSANLKQIIVSKNTADAYSPKVIRSTMGAIFRVNIIESDLQKELKELNNNGYETITTSLKATESIYDIDYKKKAVIIGNEANGVSDEVIKVSNKEIKIPMLGKTESLNASVAASIMIYEYVRQLIK